MIRFGRAIVLVTALAGVAAAQERTIGQDIPALIEQLGDAGIRKQASDRLVALGEPAAEALLRAVFREEQENKAEALQVLGRMREQSELITPELVPFPDLPAEVWPALIRAVADLAPYTRIEMMPALSSLGDQMQQVMADSEPELAAEIFNEAVRMSGRISSAPSIRAHSEVRELVSALETAGDSGTKALAAELLGYRGPSASSALPALRRALLTSHPKVQGVAEVRVIGAGRAASPILSGISIDREIHRAAARAMEAIAPGDAAVALALAHRMLHDPSAEERRDAAMALGRLGEEAAEARLLLVEALEDPEPLVVREVITALGMLGAAGRGAIPALEELALNQDPQIAERAVAAMRLVGREDPGGLTDPPEVPWDYGSSGNPVETANVAKAKVDVTALENTVKLYLLQTRSRELPTWDLLTKPDERGYAWLQGHDGPPVDPWGNEYEISPGDRGARNFEIRSRGPDGIAGTADDISSKTTNDR